MIKPKPFVGVILECCNVYVRVYLNGEGDRFEGHCPKCARPVEVKISPSTNQRFLLARRA